MDGLETTYDGCTFFAIHNLLLDEEPPRNHWSLWWGAPESRRAKVWPGHFTADRDAPYEHICLLVAEQIEKGIERIDLSQRELVTPGLTHGVSLCSLKSRCPIPGIGAGVQPLPRNGRRSSWHSSCCDTRPDRACEALVYPVDLVGELADQAQVRLAKQILYVPLVRKPQGCPQVPVQVRDTLRE